MEQVNLGLFYQGTVTRNDDPKKLGRIRAHIPAIKTETAWALPYGYPGCGPQRGFFAVPPVQSNVLIGFVQADSSMPFFLCGPWANPTGVSEVPRAASAEPVETVHRVVALETDLFEIFINDEKKQLVIRSKDKEEEIELDMGDRSMSLKTRNHLVISGASITLSAAGGGISIGGRPVAMVGGPI
jgi:hypothetical protein